MKGNKMKQLIKIALTSIFLLFCSQVLAKTVNSPEGYWKSIDDVTGQLKSIIHIWKSQDQLVGEVVKIFPKDGSGQAKLCTACTGEKHNKPIVGMIILTGLKAKQTHWGNGEILDPENGKVYSCYVRTAANGTKLEVHGYIGIPLLGRSQMWERADLTTIE